MTMEMGYGLALATGLFGAFHCLGMCSGINGGYFVQRGCFPALMPLLSYHAARIAVYALFGIGSALLGRVLVQSGIIGKGQGIVMILAGIWIMLIGGRLLGLFGSMGNHSQRVSVLVKFGSALKRSPPALIAGVINGLVPCSLVFSVAVKAAASADPLRAALLMLAFGAGTLPMMAAVSVLGSTIGAKARGSMARLAGVAVLMLGTWTLYEGVVFYDIMRGLANW